MHHVVLRASLALSCFVLSQSAFAADVQAGKEVFSTRCASCHSVGPSARGGFGPQLNAIVGRRAGSTADYRYSPEMTASGVVWTPDTLRAFVKAPGKVVPGTRMRFWGIGNDSQIDDLIAYLQTYR
ncbi:c-type cytochrome [Cupriavidus basilensis]